MISLLQNSRATRVTSLWLAASVALLAAAPLAQAQQPPKPAQQPPAAAPKPPAGAPPAGAPPAGAPAAAPAPEGPIAVAVKPEPSQTNWLKVCGKDPGNNKEICYTTRDFIAENGEPILAVAVYDVKGDAEKIVRFLLPLGFLLAPGTRFSVDKGKQSDGKFAICFPNGCFAEAKMNTEFVNSMKSGTTLNISIQNQVAKEVVFQVPLSDFAKGFDGAPVDPAVLQKQQEELQRQMEEKAKQVRERLQTPGGAPGAPAVPGAPSVPPAPKP
jgi:invasion protein IalB